MKRYYHTNYTLNENFFESPDTWTEKQAYVLGWILSDGHITKSSSAVTIRLQEKDKKILEIIKEILEYSGPLHFMRRMEVNSLITGNFQNRWSLVVGRKTFKEHLTNLGFGNDKTNSLQFPEFLKKQILPHFLRGYYDGDGTVSYTHVGEHLKFSVNLIGLDNFLTKTKSILDANINQYSKIENGTYQNKNIKNLRMAGLLSALKFYNFVYKDANFVLKRKFRKFLHLINFCKRRKFSRFKKEFAEEIQKAIEISKYIIKNAKY